MYNDYITYKALSAIKDHLVCFRAEAVGSYEPCPLWANNYIEKLIDIADIGLKQRKVCYNVDGKTITKIEELPTKEEMTYLRKHTNI